MARQKKPPLESPRTLSDIPHLSASSIGLFESCPRSWASQYLYGEERTTNKWAAIGTAVHEMHESVFAGTDMNPDWWSAIPEAERANVSKYIEYLHTRKPYVRAVEYEARVKFREDAPPILLYIDRLEIEEEGVLTIVDAKTNRRPESIDEWKKKIQIQIYQWAVRKLWPGMFHTIKWRIEYVNLNIHLEWVTDPRSDVELEERLHQNWCRLLEISGGRTSEVVPLDSFPESLHDWCSSCALKTACKTYKQATVDFVSATQALQGQNEADVYASYKLIEKLAKEAAEAIKEGLVEKMKMSSGVLKGNKYELHLKYSSRRKVDVSGAINAISQELTNNHGFASVYPNYVSELFTVKLGAIDELSQLFPTFKENVAPHIAKGESESPTIEIKQKT